MASKSRIGALDALLTPLGLSLLIAALGAAWLLLPVGQRLEEAVGLDLLFKQRGARAAPADAVVVPIEKEAAQALGVEPRPERWPRALHARLTERLHAAGAEVIVFDIHFKEPRDPAGDAALAAALRRAGRVVLFGYLERETLPGHGQLERLIPPAAPLAAAAAAVAPFALPKLPVRVNRYWTFHDSAGDVATLPMAAFEFYCVPALPALAAALAPQDAPAAARLRTALAESPAAAATEARRVLTALPRTEWDTLARAIAGDEPRRQLHALHRAYHGDRHPYLNFYGPPRSIATVPYAEVIAGDDAALAARFAGKVVFVGLAEQRQTAQRDNFYTVFSQPDGLDLSGVEIAATAFVNLVHDDGLAPPDDLAALLLVLGYGLAIAVLCRRLPAVAAVAAGLALAAAYYYIAAEVFAAYHRWLPLTTPLLVQTPLALFLGVFGHYWQSQRERRRLRDTFGHYVPGHVIDRALSHADGLHAPGERRYGTCLATDAARYTELAENMGAAELGVLMNAYYETLFAPVRAHHGMVSDVIGDAMLAIWSGPNADGALRAQALEAALEIRTAADRFAHTPGRPALVTRIGLHCGELVMGNVGALDHFEYRAVGDIVNTANRIQALNKRLGTQLLASDGVLEDIAGIATRPLGRYRLAGKQQSVAIHEVLGHEHELDPTLRTFCADFAAALALFSEGRWQAAHAMFTALQRERPDDGPTRFFIEQCAHHIAAAPADWQGVLTLAEK